MELLILCCGAVKTAVVLITGSGSGTARSYLLKLAKQCLSVSVTRVNDILEIRPGIFIVGHRSYDVSY